MKIVNGWITTVLLEIGMESSKVSIYSCKDAAGYDTPTHTSDRSSDSYNRWTHGPFKIWYSMQHKGLWMCRCLSEKGYEKCCIYFYWVFIQRGQSDGMCGALIKSAHVPVQHPGHISNVYSALLCCWNMKYAWTIKSIWTIYLNIRYTTPSKKIIKPNTHRLARARTNTRNGT